MLHACFNDFLDASSLQNLQLKTFYVLEPWFELSKSKSNNSNVTGQELEKIILRLLLQVFYVLCC